MPIKLFRLAVCDSEAQEEEMNCFVRGHKVVEIKAHFVSDGAASFWAFCVDFLDGAPRRTALTAAVAKEARR